MGKIIAFGWYGGKYSHLDWLLPLLPYTNHYCEPYGGSAAVLLNRSPSPVETYNDIDGEVVNFFRTLRDDNENLLRAISLTPFSREEFINAIKIPDKDITDVERARRFYIRARQVRTGLAQKASNGRWANCLNTSRRGMAGAVSRWLGGFDDLEEIVTRLLRVQIENDDALKVISRYDGPNTLFYCDPPYVHESRGDSNAYGFEMKNEDHIKLSETLHKVEGLVALSGYNNTLYDDLYSDWFKNEAPEKKCHSTKDARIEILWTNYDPKKVVGNPCQDRQKYLSE